MSIVFHHLADYNGFKLYSVNIYASNIRIGLKLSEALSGNDDIILRTSNIPAEKQNISLPPDRYLLTFYIVQTAIIDYFRIPQFIVQFSV